MTFHACSFAASSSSSSVDPGAVDHSLQFAAASQGYTNAILAPPRWCRHGRSRAVLPLLLLLLLLRGAGLCVQPGLEPRCLVLQLEASSLACLTLFPHWGGRRRDPWVLLSRNYSRLEAVLFDLLCRESWAVVIYERIVGNSLQMRLGMTDSGEGFSRHCA